MHRLIAKRKKKSCDVSDALVKLKFRNGGFLSGLTMWSPERQNGPTKIIGPAYTVEYAPLNDLRSKHPTHYVRALITYLPFHLLAYIVVISHHQRRRVTKWTWFDDERSVGIS